jgi:hypothetical protein
VPVPPKKKERKKYGYFKLVNVTFFGKRAFADVIKCAEVKSP